jgi:rare lipoprotein A
MRTRRIACVVLCALWWFSTGCAARTRPPGPVPAPPAPAAPAKARATLEVREGLASYYGAAFHGRIAASGARFDMNAMVAAHPTYPFGTLVRVTHLRNGRTVQVRIMDRGPARGPRADGVIIDLSQAAARALALIADGRARVRVEVLRWGRD